MEIRSRHVDRFNHDEDAQDYDQDVENHDDPIRAGYGNLLNWVARRAAVGPTDRVLELGSGTGNLTTLLPPCGRLVCVDISTEMSTLARRKLAARAAASTQSPEFVIDDVLSHCHQAPDSSFDAIVSTYTLHHLEESEKDEFFNQARRILHPRYGRLVIGDLMFSDRSQQQEILSNYRQTDREDLADEIEEEFFFDLSTATRSAQAAGFATPSHRRFSELSWGFAAFCTSVEASS